jgi:hypothetical protein
MSIGADSLDPSELARELLELLGGREKANDLFNEDRAKIDRAWNLDTGTIGKILRAHLFVEHFLEEYLARRNPNLGPLESARLTFIQKAALVGTADTTVAYLMPGVRHPNVIRNRLAHSFQAELTDQDAAVFLSVLLFSAMRDALHAPSTPSSDPLDILEDFAKHAGMAFQSAGSTFSMLFRQAYDRVATRTSKPEMGGAT